jgi:hypothetical protein
MRLSSDYCKLKGVLDATDIAYEYQRWQLSVFTVEAERIACHGTYAQSPSGPSVCNKLTLLAALSGDLSLLVRASKNSMTFYIVLYCLRWYGVPSAQ